MKSKLKKIQREENILLLLSKLDYLTTKQIQKLINLKSNPNTRRILRNMEEYLQTMNIDGRTKVYYLSKKGRERIGCETIRKKTMQIDHFIMRNDAYIYFKRPVSWKNEPKIHVPKVLTIFPDAMFQQYKKHFFLEIDNKQSMKENIEKVKKYKTLHELGVFQEKYKTFPTIIWVTTSKIRKKRLEKIMEGLEANVLLIDDIK